MQFISNDKTVRIDTIQDLKGFISQSLSTRAKRRTTSFNDARY